MYLGFFHVFLTHLSLAVNNIPYLALPQCIHSHIEGHLSCFQIFVIMRKVTVDIHVLVCVCVCAHAGSFQKLLFLCQPPSGLPKVV